MTETRARIKEIEIRKEELVNELGALRAKEPDDANSNRVTEIRKEAESLRDEEKELRKNMSDINLAPETRGVNNDAINNFMETKSLNIPLFKENRSLLVSGGKIAAPTNVYTEIGELPDVVSSIVDDVDVIDATGSGSWEFPYKKSEAEAADVTEGSAIGGTASAYDKVTVSGSVWGVLDEISNQVAKISPVAYANAIQKSAYIALRKKARAKIVAAILGSKIAEEKKGIAIDADYLRNVALGFGGDESVGGGTKLYLGKSDLVKIGKVRGTGEKKALFEIAFTDENNGTITEGGLVVPFSVTAGLGEGVQIYGQPKSVKLLLWGDYEVKTDEGGDYFKRNMLGIRGLATAGTDLAVYHGMQIIKQASA